MRLKERQNQQQHQELLDWLTPIDFSPRQSDFIRQRQAGTGQWLLDSTQYAKWTATKGEILFCHGIPGAGKTTLSSIVVDNLQESFHDDKTIAVCYFYCDFRRQDEQLLDNIILVLLKQLAQAAAVVPDDILQLYNRCNKRRSRPTLENIVKVLHLIAASFARIFLVVDALDECRTSNFYPLVSELFKLHSIFGVNILVTSRPVRHVIENFRDYVPLEIRASHEDIEKYITGNIRSLPAFVYRNSELQNEIVQCIIEAIDGMYVHNLSRSASLTIIGSC